MGLSSSMLFSVLAFQGLIGEGKGSGKCREGKDL